MNNFDFFFKFARKIDVCQNQFEIENEKKNLVNRKYL